MKKSYLKPERDVWFYFTIYDLFTMNMMGMGEKTLKYIQAKNKEKFPIWLPSHPPVYKIGSWLFSRAKEPKTSRTYLRLDWDPNLQGFTRLTAWAGLSAGIYVQTYPMRWFSQSQSKEWTGPCVHDGISQCAINSSPLSWRSYFFGLSQAINFIIQHGTANRIRPDWLGEHIHQCRHNHGLCKGLCANISKWGYHKGQYA